GESSWGGPQAGGPRRRSLLSGSVPSVSTLLESLRRCPSVTVWRAAISQSGGLGSSFTLDGCFANLTSGEDSILSVYNTSPSMWTPAWISPSLHYRFLARESFS